MFERAPKPAGAEEEAPESEEPLRAQHRMSREEAIAAIRAAPAEPLPHLEAMQRRFGHDLSGVRAHVGMGGALEALDAQAATFGDDVAFSTRHPSVELVAHEVAHVLQQRGGGARGVAADEAQADRAEQGHTGAEEFGDVKPGGAGGDPALRKKAVTHTEIPSDELDKGADEAHHGAMPAAAVTSAIAWNDKKWSGALRSQILAHLRGTEGAAEGGFTAPDVQHVARLQAGAGCPEKECDGKIGDTTMAILLHSGLSFGFDDKTKVKPSDVQLVFYPGEFEDIDGWKAAMQEAVEGHEGDPAFNVYRATSKRAPEGTGRIYVKWKGNMVDKIDCRGGPPIHLKDGTHSADPSKAGTYNLGAGKPHRTDNWYFSQIRWGAKIREREDGEIEFQDPGATAWKIATGAASQLKDPMNKYDFYDGGSLVPEWRKNDFGAMAYQIQGSPGMYIHTSPADEETALSGGTPTLDHSHGCLHVNPTERQRLEKEGFLQGGVQLVIKKYDVHLLPKGMRDKMQGEE